MGDNDQNFCLLKIDFELNNEENSSRITSKNRKVKILSVNIKQMKLIRGKRKRKYVWREASRFSSTALSSWILQTQIIHGVSVYEGGSEQDAKREDHSLPQPEHSYRKTLNNQYLECYGNSWGGCDCDKWCRDEQIKN